ncbi:hypothetical protein UFOVP273_87 [uncultured Caudovirales phage]|uniref:Uncharacterized protein n=1 Tax=uncultured Caudovirales phage TaxID=2100421 RepID=A0A6J5LIM7_9CAUD|nr:hypothetical protein UFOVP273_87 [uncultured Caudovirales phage]
MNSNDYIKRLEDLVVGMYREFHDGPICTKENIQTLKIVFHNVRERGKHIPALCKAKPINGVLEFTSYDRKA